MRLIHIALCSCALSGCALDGDEALSAASQEARRTPVFFTEIEGNDFCTSVNLSAIWQEVQADQAYIDYVVTDLRTRGSWQLTYSIDPNVTSDTRPVAEFLQPLEKGAHRFAVEALLLNSNFDTIFQDDYRARLACFIQN